MTAHDVDALIRELDATIADHAQRNAELRVRIHALLIAIAEELRPCRRCGEMLAFVRHRNGALAPYTADGVNHFRTCPHASEFSRRPAAQTQTSEPPQGTLFETAPFPD